MLILGDKELEDQTIAVREKSEGDLGAMPLEEFIEMARGLKESRALNIKNFGELKAKTQ